MIRALAITVPVTLTILDCFGYVAKVEGVSMQPCFNPEDSVENDFVFLSRWRSRSFDYKRGEIVSLISPKEPSQKIIKRIIALEGDLIRTNGYRKRYLKVPEGHCWVEGDNTGHSYDSNHFGPVSLGLIAANAPLIVWPPNRWMKLIPEVPYERTPLNLERVVGQDITPDELKDMIEEVD